MNTKFLGVLEKGVRTSMNDTEVNGQYHIINVNDICTINYSHSIFKDNTNDITTCITYRDGNEIKIIHCVNYMEYFENPLEAEETMARICNHYIRSIIEKHNIFKTKKKVVKKVKSKKKK